MALAIAAEVVVASSISMTFGADDLLRFVESVPLPGVEGRLDHMALDSVGQRLFLAALENNSVEVVNLADHKVNEIPRELREPQGVAFVNDEGLLAVANGGDGSCRLFAGGTFEQVASIDLQADADNVRDDAAAGRLYVGYGGGAIGVIDAKTRKQIGVIKLPRHPEAFQPESAGPRLFVNVPEAHEVVVADRRTFNVVATWPVALAQANFPMAIDESGHRLFIGCRKPARLLVLDTATGKTITSVPVAADADDVFYDATAKHIYVSGGEGYVSIVAQNSEDDYEQLGRVTTAAGARTSLFDVAARVLYVAVPHHGQQLAEIRVFAAK
jgi:DNA-binding beta-propeller fold protein YncE